MAVTFDTLKSDSLTFKMFKSSDSGNATWEQLKKNLLADKNVYWDVRKDNYINAYFEGANLMKLHYCSKKNEMQASIHKKYLGFSDSGYEDLVKWLEGKNVVDELKKIKHKIQTVYSQKNGGDKEKWSESFIKSQYILKNRSYCIDSEFAYKDKNGKSDIDIRFDVVKCVNGIITFVELKRLDDNRMLKETDDSPKVVEQVKKYQKFITENKKEIIDYYQKLWSIKKDLGILPKGMSRPTKVNEVPELFIFNRWVKAHPKRDRRKKRIEEILKREKISFSICSEI